MMGMEVNGQSILASIAKTPSAFAMSDPQINALAMATLLSRFKDKNVHIADIRSIATAIGPDDFGIALDHLADKDAASLAKRLDPKNPEVKAASAAWHRSQISKLAQSEVEPLKAVSKVSAPGPSQSPVRSRKPKTGDVMESKALKPRAARKSKAKSEQ